jgi:hypothetical protein
LFQDALKTLILNHASQFEIAIAVTKTLEFSIYGMVRTQTSQTTAHKSRKHGVL